MLNYGEALKYQREINGYTQMSLAKATGLKQQMISWWEAGKGLPNIDFCVRLADFYGISLDELVGRDTREKTNIKNSFNTFNNTGDIHMQ